MVLFFTSTGQGAIPAVFWVLRNECPIPCPVHRVPMIDGLSPPHTHAHTIHTHTYTKTHTHIYTHVHTQSYARAHAHSHVHTYTYRQHAHTQYHSITPIRPHTATFDAGCNNYAVQWSTRQHLYIWAATRRKTRISSPTACQRTSGECVTEANPDLTPQTALPKLRFCIPPACCCFAHTLDELTGAGNTTQVSRRQTVLCPRLRPPGRGAYP